MLCLAICLVRIWYHESMAKVSLPFQSIDVAPLPEGKSRLGDYLERVLNYNKGGLPYDQVEPIMQAAIAIAAISPFDPSETNFCFKRSMPLIETALLLTNRHRAEQVAMHGVRAWPERAEDFGQDLIITNKRGESLGFDTEWLAALLISAGCDPWKVYEEGDLPRAVSLAAQHNMTGLLRRMMDHPSAWPAQDVADHIGWEPLICSVYTGVLDLLIEKGAAPTDFEATVPSLVKASAGAIVKLLDAGIFPDLTSRKIDQLENAWTKRSHFKKEEVNEIVSRLRARHILENTAPAPVRPSPRRGL